MKILLINPPYQHCVKLPGSNQLITFSHNYAPPVGLMYLKSFLQRESDFKVKLWNAQVPGQQGFAQLEDLLGQYQPDLVGISVMLFNWYDALETARLVRKKMPSSHLVLGGPHTAIYPEESMGQPEVNSIVIGEGEYTLLEMANALAKGASLQGIAGVWFKAGGKIVRNPARQVEKNPDLFPFPDRFGFDPFQHRVTTDHLAPAAVIISSRGCPFNCTFCGKIDRHYRERSPENIIQEILAVKKLGYRSLDFYDDVFNVTKQRVMDISEALLKNKIKMPWSCRCRVDQVDEPLIAKMAESNCERISFGIESADPEILKQVKKQITPEQSVKAVLLCKQYRISTLGYYVIGFPGETLQQINQTIQFAFKLNTNFSLFHSLMPEPGSEIYQQAIQDPGFGGDYFRRYARNPVKDFQFKVWETALTEDKMLKILGRAYLRYYFRPRYLFNSFLKLTSLEDLMTKSKAGLKIGWELLIEMLNLKRSGRNQAA